MNDLSNDPRFTKLSQAMIDEIAKHEPTGVIGQDTWHEVQFRIGEIMCQVAVVNGKYVALPQSEIDKFDGIIKVCPKESIASS